MHTLKVKAALGRLTTLKYRRYLREDEVKIYSQILMLIGAYWWNWWGNRAKTGVLVHDVIRRSESNGRSFSLLACLVATYFITPFRNMGVYIPI